MLFNDCNNVYIIAEIGVNHNGSLELAKKMIYKAKEAGVDAVKFQTFKADVLLSSDKIDKAPYQKRENSNNQYEMLKKLELDYNDFQDLKSLCSDLNLDFLSTPYDEESVTLLKKLNVDTVKVASADLVNKKLIDDIINANLNIILSVGMATYDEIDRTINYIKEVNTSLNVAILHCTTSYPTDFKDVNMNVMKKLQKDYGKYALIGYSDHTEGIEASIMAVSLGAKVIEKHFTLDKNMEGPDHFASIEPKELKMLVNSIRNIEQAFGSAKKELTETEKVNIKVMRRSVHALKNLQKGDTLNKNDFSISRPCNGFSSWDFEELIGRQIDIDIKKGEPIKLGDLK